MSLAVSLRFQKPERDRPCVSFFLFPVEPNVVSATFLAPSFIKIATVMMSLNSQRTLTKTLFKRGQLGRAGVRKGRRQSNIVLF